MQTPITWPDTRDAAPPADHLYRSATWLLGRHPRLAVLARRVNDVIFVDDDTSKLSIDLDHLGEVFAAISKYQTAWDEYETRNRPPNDEREYDRWREVGPKSEDYATGLHSLLVMSSGEVASLRLLACLSSVQIPFKVSDLYSLDGEGHRLLADWCSAVQAW